MKQIQVTEAMRDAWPGISDAMKWILAALEQTTDEMGRQALARAYARLKYRAWYLAAFGEDAG